MPDTGNKKLLVVGIVALLFVGSLTFLMLTKYSFLLPKQPLTKPTEFEGEVIPTEPPLPTLSPEELEIISKLETQIIVIQNKSFSPTNLTIKLHDQVEWQNKDNETYQITGEGWGNVPIEPGESFTQAFETTGTYTYSCALHPDLTGTIVVK